MKPKTVLAGFLWVVGLLLVGAETENLTVQVITCLTGLVIFAAGGWLLNQEGE